MIPGFPSVVGQGLFCEGEEFKEGALVVWPILAPDRVDIQFGQAFWILQILADDAEDVWWLQVWQFHSGSLLVLQELGAALLDE